MPTPSCLGSPRAPPMGRIEPNRTETHPSRLLLTRPFPIIYPNIKEEMFLFGKPKTEKRAGGSQQLFQIPKRWGPLMGPAIAALLV